MDFSSFSVSNQIITGSAIAFPFVFTQLFWADNCVQTLAGMIVDIYDHTIQYRSLTGERHREWLNLLLADVDLYFNFSRLRTCWDQYENGDSLNTFRLRSEYTDYSDQQKIEQNQLFPFSSRETMEFV